MLVVGGLICVPFGGFACGFELVGCFDCGCCVICFFCLVWIGDYAGILVLQNFEGSVLYIFAVCLLGPGWLGFA